MHLSKTMDTTDTMSTIPDGFPDIESLRASLRRVIDPEVGMNIVDLGLVYCVAYEEEGATLVIEMTMTSPACPMGEMIVEDVETVMRSVLPEDSVVVVRLVWEPPWSPKMMSEEARQHYGW